MKPRLNIDKIAKGLGAKRIGTVSASGGYFGAIQLAADVAARFQKPAGGGRATDPSWTQRRLLPMSPRTLAELEHLADRISKQRRQQINPMQVASLLLERAMNQLNEAGTAELAETVDPHL